MAPRARSLQRGDSYHIEAGYACPYDTEEWISPATTLVNTSPEVSFSKAEEDVEPQKPARSAITITIPLPWSRRSSKRSSSVPTPQERRREPQKCASVRPSPVSQQPTTGISPSLARAQAKVTIEGRTSPQTTSKSTQGIPALTLKVLSPVNEGFERDTSSAATSIDVSPATPKEHVRATVSPLDDGEHLRNALRHIEFGVPLASHPTQTVPDGIVTVSRASNRSERRTHRPEKLSTGLGLAATACMRSPTPIRSPSFSFGTMRPSIALRPRSPSVPNIRIKPPEHHRWPSEDMRRDSGSTVSSDSTVATDDFAVESPEDRYYKSRIGWHGSAGAGTNGLYGAIANDYKMVGKNMVEKVVPMEQPQPLLKPKQLVHKQETYEEAGLVFQIIHPDEYITAPQSLVPTGEELWG